MSRSYADLGLDAITARADRTGEDLPPWMTEPTKEPSQADVRDWFLGTAANAMVFGMGLMLFTRERSAGVILVKAGVVLAVPGLALIALPPEEKKIAQLPASPVSPKIPPQPAKP